jgi:hypothetical protein
MNVKIITNIIVDKAVVVHLLVTKYTENHSTLSAVISTEISMNVQVRESFLVTTLTSM